MTAHDLPADEALIARARAVITGLFAAYGIHDPRSAHLIVRERFTQADLTTYQDALTVLYENGALG
ncbi:hypothetical protein [Cellulomonas hominis]|uniref:hypothetical protein n=1 Tax=Cellulomonas hominis TaxID=156981 RepID=UPI00144455A8|nr:hypothetical protein [Cellulomonas hominis]NKY08977.1 hypothetical protein [Cellulomonas hominis]